MCRLLRLVVVAPEDLHQELRRALSSLEYDITQTLAPGEEPSGTVDVAVLWEPDPATVGRWRERGAKVIALGGEGGDADLSLATDEAASLRTRIWEMYRLG